MNPKIRNWNDLRVWIIGASSGIGAETARLLLERGAKVALSARNRDGLQAIASNDNCALILPLDITRHEDLIAARDRILERWGGIDLVLVVAGTYHKMRADDPDAMAMPVLYPGIHGRLLNDNVTSPSLKPNLLISARFSITLSSIRNIQSSKFTL